MAAIPRFPHILHGGDYNPEQWKDYPDILDKDIGLMKKANINVVSLGIFSWANLEPEKDRFTFEWMDNIINKLYENGIHVVLATPSGARPQWLAQEYPEVLRIAENGIRNLFGNRENHCFTYPEFRERVRIIDRKLAERYASHPAVILWHISNEFNGDCHCEMCQNAFRRWCKEKYGTLDKLNHAWWSHFWSHTYTDWEQIHSPSYIGENSIHGLSLDWKRFTTAQTIDFMKDEINVVKSVNPDIPVTANLMGMYVFGLDYYKFAPEIDVVSWDSYPDWHTTEMTNAEIGRNESLSHDMMRALKGKPFLLMECTPSTTNWRSTSKLKKPGMHKLSVMNAIAHGSDAGMYFQIRQSRGSSEKFHSAVISHIGTDTTRVFREVSSTGAELNALSDKVYGTANPAQVAMIFDVESKWAIDLCQGPRNCGIDYFGELQRHYDYFWRNGINVDVVDCSYDFSGYKLVIAPILYMFREGIQDKLREFVRNGGTLVTTCFTGVVNDTDLCYLGEATEEKLNDVLGMWVEEIDSLNNGELNSMSYGGKCYPLKELCEIMHATTCEVLAQYDKDFYAGTPVLTVNSFGEGRAYRIGSLTDVEFCTDFYAELSEQLKLERAINTTVPDNVSITYREGDDGKTVFVQNFGGESAELTLDGVYTDLITGEEYYGRMVVDGFTCNVITKN